ncbi:hypothetical protein RND71_005295 [Anisodus tanguticus]|uniref:Uncharacterized protein n=1 Tax=Anisodus tanguticus TaxID=243964 RepID=A0AAE1VLD3_9SOLA|nr:hypothetical protein RND71_005295 [Anisodus tanguticus]
MLVLLFILLSIKDTTIAHTTHDQVEQKIVVDEAESGITKSADKEVFDGHDVPVSIEVIANGRIGGRQEMGGITTKEDSKNSVASATFSVGKFNHNWHGKLRMLQSKLSTGRNVKVNRGSLMAFSADYHMPGTHPPKNN